MSGLNPYSERHLRVNLVAGQIKELTFPDTMPSVIQIRNFGVGTVFASSYPSVSDTDYEVNSIAGGTRVFTKPSGMRNLYLYSLNNIAIDVNSWESDGFTAIDLDQTQTTVITNSTTTSSVLVTGIQGSLPAGTNTIGKVDVNSLPVDGIGNKSDAANTDSTSAWSLVSLLKGIWAKLGNITIGAALPAGGNNIGKVDVNSLPATPAGSNKIGKVDLDLTTTPLRQTATTPTIYNLTLTSANTEYSQALPANTKKFTIMNKGNNPSTTWKMYLASAAANTMDFPGNMGYTEDNILLAAQTLYFKSSNAGDVVQILAWV